MRSSLWQRPRRGGGSFAAVDGVFLAAGLVAAAHVAFPKFEEVVVADFAAVPPLVGKPQEQAAGGRVSRTAPVRARELAVWQFAGRGNPADTAHMLVPARPQGRREILTARMCVSIRHSPSPKTCHTRRAETFPLDGEPRM